MVVLVAFRSLTKARSGSLGMLISASHERLALRGDLPADLVIASECDYNMICTSITYP